MNSTLFQTISTSSTTFYSAHSRTIQNVLFWSAVGYSMYSSINNVVSKSNYIPKEFVYTIITKDGHPTLGQRGVAFALGVMMYGTMARVCANTYPVSIPLSILIVLTYGIPKAIIEF